MIPARQVAKHIFVLSHRTQRSTPDWVKEILVDKMATNERLEELEQTLTKLIQSLTDHELKIFNMHNDSMLEPVRKWWKHQQDYFDHKEEALREREEEEKRRQKYEEIRAKLTDEELDFLYSYMQPSAI